VNICAAVEDQFAQAQGLRIGNDARELLIEDLMIHVREKMFDVAFEHVGILRAELLGAVNCGVRTFSFAAGIGVVDKTTVKYTSRG
jgi:hypothetical protein